MKTPVPTFTRSKRSATSLGIMRMQPWLARVPMLENSLAGTPWKKTPE